VLPNVPAVYAVLVGAFVGAFVGEFVGAFVGEFVGAFVGEFVGAFVGEFVGAFVGEFVGEAVVGLAVGAGVTQSYCVILTHCAQSLQPHMDAMPVAGVTTPAGKPAKSCVVDLMGEPSVPEQSVLV